MPINLIETFKTDGTYNDFLPGQVEAMQDRQGLRGGAVAAGHPRLVVQQADPRCKLGL